MAAQNIVILTEGNFEAEVLKSPVPVLVDFWAEWCGPCKMLSPILDELAAEYDGRVKIAKVNVDDQPGVAGRFNVNSIPTLLLFNKGEVTDQIVGMRSKREIKARFDPVAA